ncbi:MAG: XrtA system polysaccharide deacetylase [Thermodesulfobacteriota bacterium]
MPILLTFDVEDWFQVENFKEYISYDSWPARELRVEKNTHALLDLLDEASKRRGAGREVKATFFVLGWIAERCPGLVVEISRRGHEVASHGYWHHLCYDQAVSELHDDLLRSKEVLEKIIGAEVLGYRAPSFSINDQVLQVIREAGFLYDSSYNSFDGHGRYGALTIPADQQRSAPFYTFTGPFYEIPVSNISWGKKVIPWAGGGYFRLLPSSIHRGGVARVLAEKGCFTFYMHPWEIDPGQPRVKEAKASFRLRHYVNLGRARKKLAGLISAFEQQEFVSCFDYVKSGPDVAASELK